MEILEDNLTPYSKKIFKLIKNNKQINKKSYKIYNNKFIKKIYNNMKKTFKNEYKYKYKYNNFYYNDYSYLLNNNFIAKTIKINIKNTLKTIFFIKYKNISINLICKYKTKNKTISKIINNTLNIILICREYFNNNNKINIYIYLSSVKKQFNKNKILGPENSNSGYTYYPEGINKNGVIVIFREEEYQKVLFHECIHAFGIDKKLWNNEYNEYIYNLFCLSLNEKDKININETYVEFLASIFNQIFIITSLKLNLSTINKIFEYEFIYSLSKCKQILKHYNYNIKNIYRKEKCKIFKQNTSILSYYIFKTALQINIKNTLNFYLHNDLDKFNDLIIKSMKKLVKINLPTFYDKTLRMTLFSIK